jgi:hypothetical protein
VIQKAGQAIVAALDDMFRNAGQVESRLSAMARGSVQIRRCDIALGSGVLRVLAHNARQKVSPDV